MKKYLIIGPVVFIIIAAIPMCFLLSYGLEYLHGKPMMEGDTNGITIGALGTLGDFFGGIANPIIGAIGFVALIITISLQISQNKEANRQSFENSIFNLFALQNDIIAGLKYNGQEKRMAFSEFLREKEHEMLKQDRKATMLPDPKYSVAHFSYKSFNNGENGYFGHYFRNLYRLLITIENSIYSDENKKFYARIIRAQLSMDELTVLFLNCLPNVCDDGEFAYLLYKYQMLEHLSVTNHGPYEPLEMNGFHTNDYIIGGTVRASFTEVRYYVDLEKKYKLYNESNGAFGKNKSLSIKFIREFIIKSQWKPLKPMVQ